MAETAADALVEGLLKWNVEIVFGLPGDGINGIMEALRTRRDRVRFVHVQHEEAAAFMACAYAKYTGRLGVCLATSGPGALHLLNGLYDAKADQAPVLAITGQTFSDLKGSSFQQEVNLTAVFADVAGVNQEIINPNQTPMLVDAACRHALLHRGVSHLCFPVDYQEKKLDKNLSMHKRQGHTSAAWTPSATVPPAGDLHRAAELLNGSFRPVLLVGKGALGATAEVIEIATKLGAPVVKALLGKAVLPDDHPLTTGGIGLLGTRASETAMQECDGLLIVGSSFPYIEYLPKPGQASGVQIDDRPDRIGLRYPVEVGMIGDAKATLAALSPLIEPKQDRSWLEQAQKNMAEWNDLLKSRASRDDVPMKPQRVAAELSELAADDAILSVDSGTNTFWAAQHFKIRGRQMFSCSGLMASMANGLPYAIAAKIAYPERQSIAFVGDGGFMMLMCEFLTAVKERAPITVVVIKNGTLGQIKWEQMIFLGNPEYGCDLPEFDFAKFAEAAGGIGIAVREPAELRPALESALAADRPALVEVAVDPNEPIQVPSMSAKQSLHLAQALAKGTPGGKQIALTMFRNKLEDVFG